MRTQTSVDNTGNDLCYEIKFDDCVKDKSNFFIQQNIAFFLTKICFILGTCFFKIPKNLITSAFLFLFIFFFFTEADTENIDMPRQKPQLLH